MINAPTVPTPLRPATFTIERSGCPEYGDALMSGQAHRRAATELALGLFSEVPELRDLLARGLTPTLGAPELAFFDPTGCFDVARSEVRVNRLDEGPVRVTTSFYRRGRLVGYASHGGFLEQDPFAPTVGDWR
jgi:hypothetical protein